MPAATPELRSILDGLTAPCAVRVEHPGADEYHPYYGNYVSRVPAGDFLATLRSQVAEVHECFGSLGPARAKFAYAPGKWTVQQVLGHLIDAERVFAYRATSIGRGDPSALPGFSQDDWMPTAGWLERSCETVLAEWTVVRAGTVALVRGLPAEAHVRRGIASDRPFSVRALLHVIPGHVNYHLEIVRARYMGSPGWPKPGAVT